MSELEINTIYRATEGEGVRAGTPQIFVRLQGCAIGCTNCDTMETWKFGRYEKETVDQVLARIESLSEATTPVLKRVSITGGDPLDERQREGVLELVSKLKEYGYFLNIEAAGNEIVDDIFNVVDFISFDIKTPSTQVDNGTEPLKQLISKYAGKSQIKFVCRDKVDFDFVFNIYSGLGEERHSIPWVITPEHTVNEEYPQQKILELMKVNEDHGGPFRLILQQHKVLYGSREKNV